MGGGEREGMMERRWKEGGRDRRGNDRGRDILEASLLQYLAMLALILGISPKTKLRVFLWSFLNMHLALGTHMGFLSTGAVKCHSCSKNLSPWHFILALVVYDVSTVLFHPR